jgi:hypothetical protein
LGRYDFDLGSRDDRIATVMLDYAKLKDKDIKGRWYHLYGTRL